MDRLSTNSFINLKHKIMSHRKHFKNRKPVFVAISKNETKDFDVATLKSSKWLNSEPVACKKDFALLTDFFTNQKHW